MTEPILGIKLCVPKIALNSGDRYSIISFILITPAIRIEIFGMALRTILKH